MGRGRRANSCLVSKGMEKVEMAAKAAFSPRRMPDAGSGATSILTATFPMAHTGKAPAHRGTALHPSTGARDTEHPLSPCPAASPGALSAITCAGLVSTTRGQKPPPSRAASLK